MGYDIYGETRRHEQFGYAYDAGGNLAWRTNNNLKMQFKVNGMNQLTNVSRTGSMTVFGALASRTGSETVTVSGTGLSTTPADLYTDAAWASQSGATLADGLNTWTANTGPSKYWSDSMDRGHAGGGPAVGTYSDDIATARTRVRAGTRNGAVCGRRATRPTHSIDMARAACPLRTAGGINR